MPLLSLEVKQPVSLTETLWCAGCPVGVAIVAQFTQHGRPVAQLVPDITVECTDSAVDARLRTEFQPTVRRSW